MKKIIIITLLALFSYYAQAQNEMTYQSELWDNGLSSLEKKIDISYLSTNTLVSARLADSIVNHIERFMIRDVGTDLRLILREFAINVNWGSPRVTALIQGDYSAYYTSYEDTVMTNFFDLIFSNNRSAQKELSARMRNELTVNKNTLINEICVGYTIQNNKKVIGVLIGFSQPDGYAILLNSKGVFGWYVDYYTFCRATPLEEEYYYNDAIYINNE